MRPKADKEEVTLGGARLMFHTRAGAYPFGIGLSDAAAMAAIEQMEQFCGRSLLRQAQAA
ncbi:hypothetical protein ACL9RI_09580 [Janthinobacterium sp. Mn2066]|uniref:hypothetical protein n=1 Tax=Janthinobacterium sp. Mn2066 TaxID=3395264 RepID=UPI003BCF95F2